MASAPFGGETAWKVQQVGSIVRAYHWVSDEPSMVLFSASHHDNAGAFVVCLSSAFLYNLDDYRRGFSQKLGYLPRNWDLLCYPGQQAKHALLVMGMEQSNENIRLLTTVIHDGLLDLIQMPPEPRWSKDLEKGAVVGELEVKRNGSVIMEREVHAGERGNIHG